MEFSILQNGINKHIKLLFSGKKTKNNYQERIIIIKYLWFMKYAESGEFFANKWIKIIIYWVLNRYVSKIIKKSYFLERNKD